MIDPTVRAATASDTAQLVALEGEARHGLAEHRGGSRWLQTHPAIGGTWADAVAEGRVVVAHIDDVVIGFGVVRVDGDLAHVDGVYVVPEARELGFGDELLAGLIAVARERGAALIEGHALPGDRNTKNLFERAGIKARLITVSAPI